MLVISDTQSQSLCVGNGTGRHPCGDGKRHEYATNFDEVATMGIAYKGDPTIPAAVATLGDHWPVRKSAYGKQRGGAHSPLRALRRRSMPSGASMLISS